MKFHKQQVKFSCGASAVRNCIIALDNKRISERRIRKLAKTTKAGTDSKNLIRTIKYLGYDSGEVFTKSKEYFRRQLLKILKNGGTCIVLIDSINHWISVVGYERKKIIFIDSDFKKLDQKFGLRYFIPMCRNFDKYLKAEYYYLIKLIKDGKD